MNEAKNKKNGSMNLPNALSLLRCALVPVFVIALFWMREIPLWGRIVPAIIYLVTGLTDMLDGKIARKYNLVTDFGKFIDPLADKFMVLGSLISILALILIEGEVVMGLVFTAVTLILLLRELGVTSLRLVVAGKSGIVVAASMFGKLKTVSQMVGTLVILLEPVVFPFCTENHIAAYIAMGVMVITTVASGLDYLKAYLPYIDTNS